MYELLRDLATIDDPRRQAGKRHDLCIVLFLCILSILQGAKGYRSIGRFISDNAAFLMSYLPLKKPRLPSLSTVIRVLQVVDYDQLSLVLSTWQTKYLPVQELYVDCGGGKGIGGTCENLLGTNQNYVRVCSFFEAFSGVVVSVVPYDNKADAETKVFQAMVNKLTLPGEVLITGDALHCQRKTVEICASKGFSYLFKVKQNQPHLYNSITVAHQSDDLLDFFHTSERQKGRIEHRKIHLYAFSDKLTHKWKNAKVCMVVTRSGKRKGKLYQRESYYISDRVDSAEVFLAFVRMHWLIENRLHWNKDVNYMEDKSKIRKKNAPKTLTVMRGFALGELHKNGNTQIKARMQQLTNNPQKMVDLLNYRE